MVKGGTPRPSARRDVFTIGATTRFRLRINLGAAAALCSNSVKQGITMSVLRDDIAAFDRMRADLGIRACAQ